MQIIFLAAGKGTRIYNDIKKNKCLIKLQGKTLIRRLIENATKNKIKKINIVVGFKKEEIFKETKKYKINYIVNDQYKTTEMLHSLILAIKEINDDLIISYTDIIYESRVLDLIKKEKKKHLTIPILLDWKKIWTIRNKPISEDVESLKVKNEFLTEIGKKVFDESEVQGQYMGLLYIPKSIRNRIIKYYLSGRNKKQHLTQFINNFIKISKCKVIPVNKFWYEFDDFQDLKNFKKKFLINDKNKFIEK
tara:strand:+ start:332 stop:1078 length:747 start_codon:yes stop_codon:yes gene_type:complete